MILWDYDEEEKVWEGTLEQSLSVFNSLLTHDGRLLGTAVGGDFRTIFVFDADSRAFTDLVEIPAGRPLDHGLQHGPDGIIYGMTSSCVYTLDPDTMETKVLVDGPDEFQVVGPVVGDTIYFGTNHRLRSVRLR